ncbi:glycosyltransferase family 4 protein [Microbacterium sp. LWH3-1.2]|uniref:glycosyltransferase family 4 protein n=1 Tax=Microbacterium sp. LWH3-1.2 TaxID=3135256 RepID=UPI003415C461
MTTTRDRSRVLLVSGDPIGRRMAGPAIRVWNMAEVLAQHCDVRVVSWLPIERESNRFELAFVRETDDRAMQEHEAWADVIVVQGMGFRIFPSIARTEKIVVADLYDPFQLEQLEMNKYSEPGKWAEEVTKAVSLLNEQIARADCFLAASEEQRSLWLGNLSALGRLNPATYLADPTFESLVRVVPFGLDPVAPLQRRHGIKGTVPGIEATDRVLIWGGGIYNWFDPVTLVGAMGLIADTHPDIKLFFLSARHFNPDVPDMKALADAVEAAERLGVLDRTVFFNESWVDYESRADFLLDADLGVSTHLWHAETRFSFRTRILDYMWAGLPIVSTEGDVFAELIERRGLGAVVPTGDAQAAADAIVGLLADPVRYAEMRRRIEAVRDEFTWPRVLAPLVEYCIDPQPAADRGEVFARRRSVSRGSFDRILVMPRGFRRDVALLRYYLGRGGTKLVAEKIQERRTRRAR